MSTNRFPLRRAASALVLAASTAAVAATPALAAPPALPKDPRPTAATGMDAAPASPAAVLRRVRIGDRLRVEITCTADGTLELVDSGRRVARANFRCAGGRARLTLPVAARGRTIDAVLRAGGTEMRMPLRARDRAAKPQARVAGHEPSATAYCYSRTVSQGGGGYVVVSIPQYANFGVARLGQLVYWRPWLYWQNLDTGRTGYFTNAAWHAYDVMLNGNSSSGYGYRTPEGYYVSVIGGTSAPGESYSFTLGVASRTRVAPAIETYIGGRYDWTWVAPTSATYPARISGSWCSMA
jgi:hypothetical protein